MLSEIPDEWERSVARWSSLNERHRSAVGSSTAPDRDEEYMLYQALLGAWPIERGGKDSHPGPLPEYRERETDAGPTGAPRSAQRQRIAFVSRIQQYMQKALREAKVHTTWTEPNETYEEAVRQFVARILDRGLSGDFLADFGTLSAKVSHWGMLNALSQTLLRLTAPGVPDTYQGTDLWDFSLVDPDNRRPVDYGVRRRMLQSLQARTAAAGTDRRDLARELLADWQDGAVKLYVIRQAIDLRRQHSDLFTRGDYLPLAPTGPGRDHIFAFARRIGDRVAVVIVPRLFSRLSPDGESLPLGEAVWQDTRCPVPGLETIMLLSNVFTGKQIEWEVRDGVPSLPIASVLADFPIAMYM